MAKNDIPRWHRGNLDAHFDSHPNGKDRECWKDLLGTHKDVTRNQYEDKSEEVFERRWLEYRADEADIKSKRFNDHRSYYLDDQLIKTITTIPSDSDPLFIITCFHEHFGLTHAFNQPNDLESVVNRRADYIRNLDNKIEGGLVKNYKCIYKK